MAARGDQLMKAAVLAALKQGPRDVIDLLGVLRGKVSSLLGGHEGSIHALLLSMVRYGELGLAAPADGGLIRYALPTGLDEEPVPVPYDTASLSGRAADRIASGIRDDADRMRVGADVAAHLEQLASAGTPKAFGARRTARGYLRRADRRRASVFFAADSTDTLRRFAFHEGPWILGAVIVFLVVRAFLAEVFVIPSGSMVPTLLPGDRVVVVKPGGKVMPDRWTICTFERWGTTYVKRAVGLGSETIALAGGDVLIDGALVVKPEDLRTQFRTPYAAWDFVQDKEAWAVTTRADPPGTLWTYNGDPLWSAAPVGGRIGADVRLRDVYATLELDLAAKETVFLDLVYDRPGADATGDGTTIRLMVGAHLIGVKVEGTGAQTVATGPIVPMSPPPPGTLRMHLSYVDGVIRAAVNEGRWEIPFDVPAGYVVTPRIGISGSATALLRLLLDKDLHYSNDGNLASPDALSDDDPASYGFKIPPDHVFFLGDNTHNSRDSRYRTDRAASHLGPVAVEELIGPVSFRLWPPGRMGGVR